MKKILVVVAILIIVFIVLVYSSLNSTPRDYHTGLIVGIDDMEKTDFTELDSVMIAASSLYDGKMLKKMMQGEHYRDVWTTPLKVPVVFIDSLKGGLEPEKEGGGNQTRSLKLLSEDDVLYTMRSINKYPGKLVPDYAKTLGIENIVIDGISAQHPYAAPVVAKLAKSLDLESTHPRIVFLPKQDALEDYNDKYGNALYMFEYESEGETNWTKYDSITELVDTEDLQELKAELGNKLTIDKSLLIRARLFDIIIGDWDRHAEQWGWALQERNGNVVALPIPADRDNAFFNLDGILPSLISSKYVEPELRPFRETIDYMPGLVKPFDSYFLLNTDVDLFLAEADYIQTNLTDRKIKEAFNIWNADIYKLNGEEIIDKIKARRDDLKKYARDFKNVIDRNGMLTVPLKGSDDKDIKGNLINCFECGQ